MSVHLKCDRCGAQEKTSGVMLLAGHRGPGIPSLRPGLPDGWTRPRMPNEDGSAGDRELCPQCKADLFRFMAGQPVIDDSELASQVMGVTSPLNARGNCHGCGHTPHTAPCRELTMPGAPGDVDECGCTN